MSLIGTGILRVPKEAKKGEVFRLQMVITHPMEPGTRKDAQGNLIPAHHLTKLVVSYNNREVTTINMGGAPSTNPFFAITVLADESGVIKIDYEDNKGGKWSKDAEIKVV